MTTLDQIAKRIITEQALIIGPIAWHEAKKVSGLKVVNQSDGEISIDQNLGLSIIDNLVKQYENIFGRASREVCKEAVAALVADLPVGEVPTSLQ